MWGNREDPPRQGLPVQNCAAAQLPYIHQQVSQQNLPPHQNLQPHISNIGHLAHPQQAHRATAMDSKRACPLGGPAGIRHTADYFKSLGYRCPHCDRDFTAMSVNARNGSMTRHMKKCAAEKAGRPLSTGEGGVRAAPAATLDDKGSGRRPSYPPATKGGAVDSADIAGVVQGGNESGWWVRGSEYLGRRVRRAVYDEDSGEIVGAADGAIVGWLPEEVADFVSEFFNCPAALWHLVYDDECVGEEDLEEFEVRDAIQSYLSDAWAHLGGDEDQRERAARRDAYLKAHPPSSFPPLPHLAETDGHSDEELGGARKRGREEMDELEEAGDAEDDEQDEQVRMSKQDEEVRGSNEEGREALVEVKRLPKRHREGCTEDGTWRVTECPKKPVNAYMMWYLENRQDIQQQNAGMAAGKLSRIASQLWKAMPESVKNGYKRRSLLALDEFHRDVAAYKEYCAAEGKRPKFACGGGGKEVDEDAELDNSLDAGKRKVEGKDARKRGRLGKHPPVDPWFALVVESEDGSNLRLLEVSSGVHVDGSCKAREWLVHDVAQTAIDKGATTVTRFVAASLYPQMMSLPLLGWVPVEVLWGDKLSQDAAEMKRPSPVEASGSVEDHESLVVIRNEAQFVAEARGILLGENELEPFPARAPPPPREVGTRKVPASPDEYLRNVEGLLMADSPEICQTFFSIVASFKSSVAAGTAWQDARLNASREVAYLFREPPHNRLIAGFEAFLPAQPSDGTQSASNPSNGVAAVASDCQSSEVQTEALLPATHLCHGDQEAHVTGKVGEEKGDGRSQHASCPAGAGEISTACSKGGQRQHCAVAAGGGCPFLAGIMQSASSAHSRHAGADASSSSREAHEFTSSRDRRALKLHRETMLDEAHEPTPETEELSSCKAGDGIRMARESLAQVKDDESAPGDEPRQVGGTTHAEEQGQRAEGAKVDDRDDLKEEPGGGGKVEKGLEQSEVGSHGSFPGIAAQLEAAWVEMLAMLEREKCAPIMLRLAWHDASSFDASSTEAWPMQGGANGSIRLVPELDYPNNKGLAVALSLLNPLFERFDKVSAADLLQMAGAAAVQVCGGPHIRLRYGRKQTENSEHCCGEARSKSAATAAPPFQDGETAVEHVRRVFSRMGFNDAEAVALMGAHTLGRAHRSRSGHGAPHTPYTKNAAWARPRGGSSWTADWDRFDNGYFRELMASKHDEHLLKLPTDLALLQDQSFREHVKRFAEDENVFFREYAAAHVRMSEAGALFDPPKGIYVDLSKKSSKT